MSPIRYISESIRKGAVDMTSEELTRLFVDYGALTLTTSDGTLIGNTLECKERNRFCDVGFQDQSGHRLTEFIFDISLEDLEGASLDGNFTSGGYLLDGDWEVTFSFNQSEIPEEDVLP